MTGQRTLSLAFRDFNPTDYDRLAEIYIANYPEYAISAAEQRSRDDSIDKSKYLLKRIACLDIGTAKTLGFGSVAHVLDMFHPRKFMISIYVDPNYQGLGVGGAIYERVSDELAALNAEVAWAMNREDLLRHREFFETRGFREKRRDWESRLELASFKPETFLEYRTKMQNQGIEFSTLALEMKNGVESMKELHELVQLITEDMPRQSDFTPLSFEQWHALLVNNPRLLPDGYIIAKDGPHYVGLSNVLKSEKEPLVLTQDDTGVRRQYRGRGIATALKLKVIEYARRKGYLSIKTWNDSTNAAMLAVNTKLGFRRHVGWILLEKDL